MESRQRNRKNQVHTRNDISPPRTNADRRTPLGADMLSKEEKAAIAAKFGHHEHDTGSPEVQIAQLTRRIALLTEHLREHRHDYHTRRALTKLVGQRRRQLRYLNREDVNRYSTLVGELGLRR